MRSAEDTHAKSTDADDRTEALSGALGLTAKPATRTLKNLTEFDLPGPPGKRFDDLTIDSEDHYLLSAHLAAGQMYVIDLRTNKIVATVTDTPGAEGVEYVPELKKAYTSNAYDNTIGVVDLRQICTSAGGKASNRRAPPCQPTTHTKEKDLGGIERTLYPSRTCITGRDHR